MFRILVLMFVSIGLAACGGGDGGGGAAWQLQ